MVLGVEFRVAWWWDLYLYGVVMVAMLMNADPDPEKVVHAFSRAVQWRFVGTRRWRSIF